MKSIFEKKPWLLELVERSLAKAFATLTSSVTVAMKRARSKAAAAAPAAQRLNPVALRVTSAARDSQALSSFSSGSHSSPLSAKDVRAVAAHRLTSAAQLNCAGLRQRQEAKGYQGLAGSAKGRRLPANKADSSIEWTLGQATCPFIAQ